jgi:hypothetical protein
MGNRKKLLRALSAIALAVPALCGWTTPAKAQAGFGAGAAHTGIVRGPANVGPVTVTWTLRDEDLFACVSAAYDLRALVRSYGSAVAIRVVAVDSDPSLVAAFMRRERLDANVTYLSTREYRQAYRTSPVPGIAVGVQGRLVESVNAGLIHVRNRRGSESLEEIVRELLVPSRYSFAN